MGLLTNLFGKQDVPVTPALKDAVEYAVSAVAPLLMQTSGYPDRYLKPVSVAMEYTRQLADSLPGPVNIDHAAYNKDALVHVLFSDSNAIADAITSCQSMQEYLRTPPSGNEFYALMGMRRVDKRVMGMEQVGSVIQREVVQQATYFTSHTIEHPSPDEALVRERIAKQLFQRLVSLVKARIEQRRQSKETLLMQKKELTSHRLHTNDMERSTAEERAARLTDGLQSIIESLDPEHYLADFEAVLLNPQEYLQLKETPITLDSMGIRRATDDAGQSKEFMFSELTGYDRRKWTVTLVRCSNLKYETFAERLDKAYRYLKL